MTAASTSAHGPRCRGSGFYTGLEPGDNAICVDCGRLLTIRTGRTLPRHNTSSNWRGDPRREEPPVIDDPAVAALAERFMAGAIPPKRANNSPCHQDHLPRGQRKAEGPLPRAAAHGLSLFTKGKNGRNVRRG